MSSRSAAPARRRPLATAPTALLGLSLGVLGWLLVQAATFGVAEHTHLTDHGVTAHRHAYAPSLALASLVCALVAVLLLVLLRLAGRTRGDDLPSATHEPGEAAAAVGRRAPATAALLFVLVEARELAAAGTPAVVACGILLAGAAAQVLVAHAAAVAARSLVRGVACLTAVPTTRTWRAAALSMRPVSRCVVPIGRVRVRRWDGRAPPWGAYASMSPS